MHEGRHFYVRTLRRSSRPGKIERDCIWPYFYLPVGASSGVENVYQAWGPAGQGRTLARGGGEEASAHSGPTHAHVGRGAGYHRGRSIDVGGRELEAPVCGCHAAEKVRNETHEYTYI